MANKISQFWQELKRRNVTRVMAVYIAAAFMLLELVDMISDPFGLPDWSMKVGFFILLAGLIIAFIISWLYDIRPESGIVKTEPAHKVKTEDPSKSSKSWRIASYISFVVIVALIVLNIIPRTGKKEILDKSIAVLPFKYLSEETDKQYLADGAMDEILLNLSKIEDLRVLARTSVEQYRVTDKTATEICQELDVAFVLEGSFLKNGDQVRIIVQLIESGREGHAWAKKYDRSWKDIFSVQSEIAQLVAKELQAVITPEEKQLLEKIPTTNLTAFDFYQRGQENMWKWWLEDDSMALDRADALFQKALEYDSTFAPVYTGLGWIYMEQTSILEEHYLDSVPVLADIALSYDNQLAEAYELKGIYYQEIGKTEQAIAEYKQAIKINPNYFEAFWDLGNLYHIEYMEIDLAIYYLNRAISLHRGKVLPRLYHHIAYAYLSGGFIEQAKSYSLHGFKLDADTALYYSYMSIIESFQSNYQEAIRYAENSYRIDTSRFSVLSNLGKYYTLSGQEKKALAIYRSYESKLNAAGIIDFGTPHLRAYAYWKNGYKDEANAIFKKHLDFGNKIDELGRSDKAGWYAVSGLIYAFQGEYKKAYDYLDRSFQGQKITYWEAKALKDNPLFDSMRDEPKFQQLLKDVEAKNQAEHERVRLWLEENDLL